MQIRRTTAVVAATVVTASLTLAACGSSKKSSGGSSGGSKKTVEIGFQGPLSVNSPQLGLNAEYGIKVAIAQANAAGTLPYNLAIKVSDDQGTPAQGPTAAKVLIDDPNVIAVVGPMFSGATKASEPSYSQANLLSVTPSATDPSLTQKGFTTFFRLIPNDNNQGKGAADYMAKVLNAKKVFSLDDKSDYGTGLSTALDAELKADNVAVTHDGINPTKDYSAEASKIIAANPDVLYYSGYYQDFSLLAKALRGAGFKGTLFSGDGSNDDQYIVGAGKANAEGTYLSCGCGDANSDPKAASFVTAVAADNSGAKPGTYSGEAFDATNSIISVLKTLGSSPTRAAVVAAYKSVDFQGLTKEVKYDSSGEIEGNAIYIYQVKNGVRAVLGTTGELIK